MIFYFQFGKDGYTLQLAKQANLFPAWYDADYMYRILQIYYKNIEIMYRYKAQPYANCVTLFRATGTNKLKIDSGENKTDETLGWKEWVSGSLDIHSVPGNHTTVLERPHVDILAQKLKTILYEDEDRDSSKSTNIDDPMSLVPSEIEL